MDGKFGGNGSKHSQTLMYKLLDRKIARMTELYEYLEEFAETLVRVEEELYTLEEDFGIALVQLLRVDKDLPEDYLDYVHHEIIDGEIYLSVYTPEETTYLVDQYNRAPSRETVKQLAEEMQKTEKSVIGKLSREGVYQREGYKTKAGLDPVTKVELVSEIAEVLGEDAEKLSGLEKSPKPVLQFLLNSLSS